MRELLNGGGLLAALRLVVFGPYILAWQLAREELSHWKLTRTP